MAADSNALASEPDRTAPHSSDRVVGGILLLASLAVAVLHFDLLQFFCDDAYISFRYSRNLAEGHGLVYNPGEYVEGYTNFLWVLWIALGFLVGIDAEPLSLVSGIVLFAATAWLAMQTARRWFERSWAFAAVPVLWLACLGPMILWSSSGLETILFTTLVLVAVLAYQRGFDTVRGLALAGVCYALATMVRPDGVVFGGAAGLHLVISGSLSRPRSWSALGRRAAALAGGFLVVFGPFMLWRYSYYDDWLPNTFYVKKGSVTGPYLGSAYLRSFLTEYPALCALSVIGGIVALTVPAYRALRGVASHFLVLTSLFLGYMLWAGGDYMALYRFLVPVLPFAVLLATLALHALLTQGLRGGSKLAALRAVALLVVMVGLGYWTYHPSILSAREGYVPRPEIVAPQWRMKNNTWRWSEAGRALKATVDPNWTIATTAAGALPYFAELKTIDQSGLCDRYTAKEASDIWMLDRPGHKKQSTRQYLQRRSPEIILWHPHVWQGGRPIATLPPAPRYVQYAMEIPDFRVEDDQGHVTGRGYLYLWLRRDMVGAARAAKMVPALQAR